MKSEKMLKEAEGKDFARAFYGALESEDAAVIDGVFDELRDMGKDPLKYAAVVGTLQTIAQKSPYAAVTALETAECLPEPAMRMGYAAIASTIKMPLDRNLVEVLRTSPPEDRKEVLDHFGQEHSVDTMLKAYCVGKAGMEQ